MLSNLTRSLDFHLQALELRAQRQRILASNMANADTPGYVARDFVFADALRQASSQNPTQAFGLNTPHRRHLPGMARLADQDPKLLYAVASQPSADHNSVDMDRERAAFADNAIRYETQLRFITGHVKTMLSAIQGQS